VGFTFLKSSDFRTMEFVMARGSRAVDVVTLLQYMAF
jgi:hypothetical protein